MKICDKCNTQNNDNARFCAVCGNALDGVQNTPKYTNPVHSLPVNELRPSGNGRFVSEDEYVVATLENGVMMNIISGEGFRREDAVLTNKRLYYNHKDGIVNIAECEEIVDVKDVTGTKITRFDPYGILIIAGLLFIAGLIINANGSGGPAMFFGIILSVVAVFVFVFLKKKYLRIEYAGGSIHFSVKKYGIQNIQAFQRSIYAVKDSFEKGRG